MSAVCISFNFVSFPQFQELTLNTANAYFEAQKVGENASLCAAGSAFNTDYGACRNCIAANTNSTSLQLSLNVTSEFQPFLSFCASPSANPSYLSAAKSSLLAQASSYGLILVSTVQITVTVAQPPTCQLSLNP
jgi:hypothetical protein